MKEKKLSELYEGEVFRFLNKAIWYEFDFFKHGVWSYADVQTGEAYFSTNGDKIVEVRISQI